MSESTDTRAPMSKRRRVAIALVAGLGFAVVMASVEFLTARGQFEFGQFFLHLNGWERIAAYSAVQGSLLATAGLAVWSIIDQDTYLGDRLWTAILLLGSAGVAYMGAVAAGWPRAGAIATAVLALVALRTWHRILRRVTRGKRTTKRAQFGGFDLIRWVLDRKTTWQAYRLVVLDKMAPDAALAAVRGQFAPVVTTGAGETIDLSKLRKVDAIRRAFEAIGSYDAVPAMTWLAERGVTVDRSQVYAEAKKLIAARKQEIHAVNGKAA